MSYNRRYGYNLNASFLILLFLLIHTSSYSQIDSLQTPHEEETPGQEYAAPDTIQKVQNPWQPNPKKALWYSLAFPGLGQIYNHSWWKAPVIYGGLGVSIWFISENNKNYKDFRIAYSESFDPNTDNLLVKKYPNQESLRRIRDIYYKRYQLSIIATAAIYLMNGLEAYVDAHLKNFEISDDLSFQLGVLNADQNIYNTHSLTQRVFPVVRLAYRLD